MMKKLLSFIFGLSLFLSACTWSDKDYEDTTSSEPLKIALVTMEGGTVGNIGCGDAIEFIQAEISTEMTVEARIEAALEELFSIETALYGESGLYNALSSSSISVVSVDEEENGDVNVALTGALLSAGTCDDPRIEEQIKQTIAANAETNANISVTINGQDLNAYFDMSGGAE